MVPTCLNYAPPFRNDLRTIALRQKTVMYCILGYFPLAVAIFALPPESLRVVGLLAIGVTLTMAAFVFMLSLAVYSTGIGIVLGIFTLIPVLGLIPLVIINEKATNILRAHGIRVGLMGADSRHIPGPG
jgi:hypothetical protein